MHSYHLDILQLGTCVKRGVNRMDFRTITN